MNRRKLLATTTLIPGLILAGCAGTKMLRKPVPPAPIAPLAATADDRIALNLDAVIFRGGPGSWAKNVDWDEYVMSIRNTGSEPIQIRSITLRDSLGTRIEPGLDRNELVRGTRAAKRRYKGEGLTVRAGVAGGVLVGAGAAAAAGSTGLGAAAMAGGGAAAAAAAVVVLVPALAVGGIVRGVNNSKVNGQIEARQTPLPIELAENEETATHIFFPVSPSPLQLELDYVDSTGNHLLILDTKAILEGLHLGTPS